MYSVLIISSMYKQTLNIKRMIPWEEYACDLYIEYSDSSTIDTLHEIMPDILIFTNRPLYIDQSALKKALHALKKRMEIIVIDSNADGGAFDIKGINQRTISTDQLSPDVLGETIKDCCRTLRASASSGETSPDDTEAWLKTLLDAQPNPGNPFYLLRVRFADKARFQRSDEKKIEKKFKKALGTLYGGLLVEGAHSICILIYDGKSSYTLFSLRTLEKVIEELLVILGEYRRILHPALLTDCYKYVWGGVEKHPFNSTNI